MGGGKSLIKLRVTTFHFLAWKLTLLRYTYTNLQLMSSAFKESQFINGCCSGSRAISPYDDIAEGVSQVMFQKASDMSYSRRRQTCHIPEGVRHVIFGIFQLHTPKLERAIPKRPNVSSPDTRSLGKVDKCVRQANLFMTASPHAGGSSTQRLVGLKLCDNNKEVCDMQQRTVKWLLNVAEL